MKPRQKKSRFYYYFWGTATAAVVLGQVYVGIGYRMMSKAVGRVLDTILIEVVEPPTTYPY